MPDLPEALKAKYEADFALADSSEAAYAAGKADITVLEESARIRAQAKTEIGILAAETGSIVVGGAGAAVKVVRTMGKIDFDNLPDGLIGAVKRRTEAAQTLAQDLRSFAANESGALDLEPLPPGKKITRDWFKDMWVGRQFDADNAHRYQFNQITVVYAGNKSGYARVDSFNLTEGALEIVSRKHTQLADVTPETAKNYLRALSVKYPEGALIADTPKNRELGIENQRLKGTQILEVPVQDRAIPQEVLDYANKKDIKIRDIDGHFYN